MTLCGLMASTLITAVVWCSGPECGCFDKAMWTFAFSCTQLGHQYYVSSFCHDLNYNLLNSVCLGTGFRPTMLRSLRNLKLALLQDCSFLDTMSFLADVVIEFAALSQWLHDNNNEGHHAGVHSGCSHPRFWLAPSWCHLFRGRAFYLCMVYPR